MLHALYKLGLYYFIAEIPVLKLFFFRVSVSQVSEVIIMYQSPPFHVNVNGEEDYKQNTVCSFSNHLLSTMYQVLKRGQGALCL